jgi:hypothetical protein
MTRLSHCFESEPISGGAAAALPIGGWIFIGSWVFEECRAWGLGTFDTSTAQPSWAEQVTRVCATP